MLEDIKLNQLNRAEAYRYMGYGNKVPDNNIRKIVDKCESEILEKSKPMCVYKVFDIEEKPDGIQFLGTDMIIYGNSIKELLLGCKKAVLLCATLSYEVDRLIRKMQIKDMTNALVTDALACVAIEQYSEKIEEKIKDWFPDEFFTYRFGIGYGDSRIEQIKDVLKVLDAERKIGVTCNSGMMMTPTKSVATVIGICEIMPNNTKRGCISCNMREKCKFRVRGERCGF